MEWATSIDLHNSRMGMVDKTLERHWMATSRAFNRGTPTTTSTRTRITVSLESLRQSEEAEDHYLEAFELKASSHTRGGHLVFETTIDGVRYVIPALVLMRTFFTPCRYLLDTMFRAQALDQTCFVDFGPTENAIAMVAPWATVSNARRFAPWESRLTWMLSHKSAFRMAGSVHEFAARGIIGLCLPLASVSFVVDGLSANGSIFVTKCTLLEIAPEEQPCFEMGLEPTIVIDKDAYFSARSCPRRKSAEVPAHADGSLCLTDDEWQVLKKIVQRNRANRYKHCPRLLLDGVLAKLASKNGWRQSTYKVGNWQNATYTHQALRKSGALDAVLNFLRSTRERDSTAVAGQEI